MGTHWSRTTELGNQIQNQAPLTDSPELLWDLFKHSIQEIKNQFIPFKYSSKRYSLLWINKDINKINKKQRLYNKAKKYQRETDWTSFKKFRKATQKKIQSEYGKYLTHLIGRASLALENEAGGSWGTENPYSPC